MFFSLPHGAANEVGVPLLFVSGKLAVVVFAKERGCECMLVVIDAKDSKDANIRACMPNLLNSLIAASNLAVQTQRCLAFLDWSQTVEALLRPISAKESM